MPTQTYAYGFPRLGKNREYKKAVEAFWKGELSEELLYQNLHEMQQQMISTYKSSVDSFPVGEITSYDLMLDTAIMVGLYKPQKAGDYYDMCRGKTALSMTKWFNTNYHYLVPDFSGVTPASLNLHWNKPAEYLKKFNEGNPHLIGPFTLLKLSKGIQDIDFDDFMFFLGEIYFQIASSVPSLHIDEPALVLEISFREWSSIKKAYSRITESGSRINMFTFYDSVDNLQELYDIPFSSLGLDFVHGDHNFRAITEIGFPEHIKLIAGIIDGRNIWKTDMNKALSKLGALSQKIAQLGISNACPLSHLPVSIQGESKIDPELKTKIAFAQERLSEIAALADLFDNQKHFSGKVFALGQNEKVRSRVASLVESDFVKSVNYRQRHDLQKQTLNLPALPTTTIGSFSQTSDLRSLRAALRSGKVSQEDYSKQINDKIKEAISFQEQIGLDVLVHGEFERTDMVEFFAEQLNGFLCTERGWVLSYGTRAYRPPIIYGDISRSGPITLEQIAFAQSLTKKPVKGMLTGPVTIIAWSFVREDIPVSNTAFQIALCLQDEIADYENAQIKIVQVDEPAFKEKAPLKKRDWQSYFSWAIKAFNLATMCKPQTQIHTHMCYSDFRDILDKISELDFDVISIEASRGGGDLIEQFKSINFKKQIGLGVWDIHSTQIPSKAQISSIIQRALEIIPREQFWINPDCGLKTRNWVEIVAALKNMVAAAVEGRVKEG